MKILEILLKYLFHSNEYFRLINNVTIYNVL